MSELMTSMLGQIIMELCAFPMVYISIKILLNVDKERCKWLFIIMFSKIVVFNTIMAYLKFEPNPNSFINDIMFLFNGAAIIFMWGGLKIVTQRDYLHICLTVFIQDTLGMMFIIVPFLFAFGIYDTNSSVYAEMKYDEKTIIIILVMIVYSVFATGLVKKLLTRFMSEFYKSNIKLKPVWWMLIGAEYVWGMISYSMDKILQGNIVILYCAVWLVVGILILYEVSLWVRKRQEKLIRQENQILTVENAVMKEYYETLQYQVERTRRFRHDIEKHMNVIKEMIEDSGHGEQLMDYAEHMGQSYDYLKTELYCSNQVLNAILVNKKHQCEENGICFEIKVDELDIGNIKEMDIVAVLANLLDNAIEECVKLKSQSETSTEGINDKQSTQPCVKLACSQKADNLIIKIENTTLRKDIDKSVIKTTKKDDFAHGVGLSIVKDIIEKYSGNIEWNSRNNVFSVEVSMKNQNS